MTTFAPALPGLRASRSPPRCRSPPTLHVRSFLLERDHGNVLVYGSETAPALAADAPGSTSTTGTSRCSASSRTSPAPPALVHEADAVQVATRAGIVPVTFAVRHELGEGFELIPTPGHTPGATAYLYEPRRAPLPVHRRHDLPARRRVGRRCPRLSDRVAYVESLALLRSLEFDVLVPWAARAGEPFHAFTGPADTRRRIDALLRL